MKIISYNLNGIRSAMSKGFVQWLAQAAPDVLCLQELKAQTAQIDTLSFQELGYAHCYWNPAVKKGYSGTAILSKIKPHATQIGMGIPEYDREGRLICLDYGDFLLVNSYFPSGTMGGERQAFKMKYLDDFYKYAATLLVQKPMLVAGDFNICHHEIDINHPERHGNVSGFLPEERRWMDKFEKLGFVDTFRMFNKSASQYSWWSFRAGARERNQGWRIDYFWASHSMQSNILAAHIHPDAMHSDHCAVSVELNF